MRIPSGMIDSTTGLMKRDNKVLDPEDSQDYVRLLSAHEDPEGTAMYGKHTMKHIESLKRENDIKEGLYFAGVKAAQVMSNIGTSVSNVLRGRW